jgi:acyl carrier protein
MKRLNDGGIAGRMQTRDEVLAQVKAALVELFEIEPDRVTPSARLNEDLEIDSIDAVDLMDRLRRQTGRKISAENFRSVRTVDDLVTAVHALVQA